jgi:hypothetical protein
VKLLACISAALCAPAAFASPASVDLGQGLAYHRVHALPADLPSHFGAPSACVLDLRYASSDAASAGALGAWIRFNASERTPVFVLENASTGASILAAVPAATPGVIVLAPRASKLAADIEVSVEPAADRRAYEAVEKGAPVDSLLHDYPDKPRVDEAFLDKEHIPDSEAPESASDSPPPPMPMTDALLQRAVQLHRGLVALKRL